MHGHRCVFQLHFRAGPPDDCAARRLIEVVSGFRGRIVRTIRAGSANLSRSQTVRLHAALSRGTMGTAIWLPSNIRQSRLLPDCDRQGETAERNRRAARGFLASSPQGKVHHSGMPTIPDAIASAHSETDLVLMQRRRRRSQIRLAIKSESIHHLDRGHLCEPPVAGCAVSGERIVTVLGFPHARLPHNDGRYKHSSKRTPGRYCFLRRWGKLPCKCHRPWPCARASAALDPRELNRLRHRIRCTRDPRVLRA